MSENNSQTAVFKSKRDTWITIFIWTSALLLCLFAYGIMVSPGPIIERLFGASIALLIGLIGPWFWFTTYYRITESSIHLHSGIFHKELNITDIKGVTFKGDGSGYSFAFSGDSIHIEVEGSIRGYKVSPLDRRGFMIALDGMSDHLQICEDDLVPLATS